jgi:predicted dehydrogenase
MNSRTNRRSFLKRAAMASGALSAAHLFPSPNILRAASSGDKVNCALIGCGGRGMAHVGAVAGENLVAIVDPNEARHAVTLKTLAKKNPDAGNVQAFTDYRQMFDKIAKQIDAVFVAAPNHHHATASMMAMQLGKNVYCEKPLCHDVA